ncbi:MAG: hypothetical protein IJD18_00170 [Clostridia bacterium]|nr:hypothetical protein [Clostridia bacterium]MBR2966877.1 hypothetical protein [Clostridia bacterium]
MANIDHKSAMDAKIERRRGGVLGSKGYRYDPVEDTAEYKAIEEELHAKILQELGGQLTRGNAQMYPQIKKEILKRDYGIDWKSPQELNPRIRFN